MHDLIPIAALRPGQIAEVRQIAGRMEQIRRLEELGVRDGVIVEVVRAGTPCIIRVGGTRLCFRDGELCSVMVAARKSA
jgi:ferrous iron transport protein A